MPPPSSVGFAYRPAPDPFTARWQSLTPAATTQAEYDALLQAPEALGTPHWLLDVRRRPVITLHSARWVTQNWLSRPTARLRLAFLVARLRAANLRLDPALRAVLASGLACTAAKTGAGMSLRNWLGIN